MVENELVILAGLLSIDSGEALEKVKTIPLKPEDFQDSKYRKIYRGILEVDKKGEPVEIATVTKYFKEHQNGEAIEFDDLEFILNSHVSIANYDFYLQSVIEAAQKELHGDIDKNLEILQSEKDRLQRIQDFKRADIQENKKLVFPESVISGVAGEYANLYHANLEIPKEFLFISFLTCLGIIVADKVRLLSELNTQPRLFTILLGESSGPRKSTSIDKTLEFFKEAIYEGFNTVKGLASAEGLYKVLKKISEKDKNGFKKLLLSFDEFKEFVSKATIQNSVLLPKVNTLFESNFFENRTKKSEEIHDNVFLSILAASTIDTYKNTWTPAFTDIGFNNRLFIVPGSGERRFSIPQKVSEDAKKKIKRDVAFILTECSNGLELTLTPEAFKRYDDWYLNLENSIHTKRIDTYAIRFMQLLAINDLKLEIDLETVEKTIALMDWQISARRLYDPIDAENTIAKIEREIINVLTEFNSLNERALKKKIHYERYGTHLYKWARKNLIEEGDIEQIKGRNKRSSILKICK